MTTTNQLPPNLQQLIDNQQFDEAQRQVAEALTAVEHDSDNDAYTKNYQISQCYFQHALIAYAQGLHEAAFDYAKQSFHYDVFSFDQHLTLINIALANPSEATQAFTCEVAWWAFRQLHEGDATAIIERLEALTSTQDLPMIEQWLLQAQCFAERMRRLAQVDSQNHAKLQATLRVFDEYAAKGVDADLIKAQKSNALFAYEQYNAVIELWEDTPLDDIENKWEYTRLLFAYIYTGRDLPETLRTVDTDRPHDYYDLITSFRELLKAQAANGRVLSEHQQTQANRVLRHFCEYGLARCAAVENGECIDGYLNDAHRHAMFCRNFGSLLESWDERALALDYSEKGFALSPFIENGWCMSYLALDIGDYERAERNVAWVKRDLEECLGFYDHVYLDSQLLRAKAMQGKDAYFAEEAAFQKRYGDFLHYMRVNALIDGRKRPQAVIEWTDAHNVYIGNIEIAAKLLFEQWLADPDIIAYYFAVQALTGNRSQVEWSKAFADNLAIIKADPSHPNYARNWFIALCGYGYLKLRQGNYEGDETCFQEGVAMLEEAANMGVGDARQVADCHFKIGRYYYVNIDDDHKAEHHLSKAIALLEQAGTSAEMTELGFIGDPLLSLAYWYRGLARDSIKGDERLDDLTIADDFARYCELNDSAEDYLGSHELAYFWSSQADRIDAQYQHAMHYIDTVAARRGDDRVDNNDEERRADVMSLTLMNLIDANDKARAEPLFAQYLADYPDHEDSAYIAKMMKKIGKRKKFLGIF